jgi:hypothetical protein
MKAYLKEHHSSEFGSRLVFTLDQNKITDPNFTWEVENEEFRYRQDLYDVISVEKKAGKLEIVCLKDANENQLESQLNEIHKLNMNNSSKSSYSTIKFFSVFYFQQNNSLEFTGNKVQNKLPFFSSVLLTRVIDTLQPPPDDYKI